MPLHCIFNFNARILCPFSPQHMKLMVTILESMNKRGVHFVFISFHIPPRCSAAMKVGGRHEEDLLRYTFSLYFYMQWRYCYHPPSSHINNNGLLPRGNISFSIKVDRNSLNQERLLCTMNRWWLCKPKQQDAGSQLPKLLGLEAQVLNPRAQAFSAVLFMLRERALSI